ncbi:hypothetical protein HGRIS_002156 [Hohenbuehelia grisea]|uniref:FMN hydroxy acid dehydrogenase domain-containing protein n=1 Tax=Hohenbuehelia grisea TaxID=104357 RepID=A0ABR3JJV5_9AGAR
MDPFNKKQGASPHYSLYQRELLKRGPIGGLPNLSCEPSKLQESTKDKLTDRGYWYASSNAGLGWTDRANREAFYHWRIIPKMLRDTRARDLTVDLFGHTLPAPILFAPIGINKIYHPEGELIPARVAGKLGLGYCLSTAASRSIEEVAAANGNGPRFFQLYMSDDDELTTSLLERAFKNGFDVMMLTLDTWQLGWRPTDTDIGNYAFYYGEKEKLGTVGNEMGESDPVFMRKHAEDLKQDSGRWIDSSVWHGKAHTWDKMPWLKQEWSRISKGRPFVLKGIQCVEDALRAIEVGADGIVVSNHAGRQVDGAVGSLEVLPEIVDAVGDKLVILYDSGIRGGADVFKALALGAKAVMFGRLWVWGMAHGEAGCMHITKSLLADFDILMTNAGFASVKEISRKDLRYSPHVSGGGVKL